MPIFVLAWVLSEMLVLPHLGVIIINFTIELDVTKENTVDIQKLALKLVMAGIVSQENA